MKIIYPKNKSGIESADLAAHIKDAYSWASDFKEEAQQKIIEIENYFRIKEATPNAWVGFCDDGECEESGAFIHIDSISTKIDAFIAVAADAIIQVDKPWLITPTKIPSVNKKNKAEIVKSILTIIGEKAAEISQGDETTYYQALANIIKDEEGSYETIREHRDEIIRLIKEKTKEVAERTAKQFDDLVLDGVEESQWSDELASFTYNFAKYDFAVMKAPTFNIGYKEEIEDGFITETKKTVLSFENIHPANYFCSSDATWSNSGTFEIDISSISLNDLQMCVGHNGFIEKEIKACVNHFKDIKRNWLDENYNIEDYENWLPYEHIDAIKYNGKITKEQLFKHISGEDIRSIKKTSFKDNVTFECEIWVIDDFVVYQKIILSNIISRPYKVSTYSKRGQHRYQGKGIYSLCIKYQIEIDKFYNLMLENADLASGGIIGYDRKKIAAKDFHPSEIRGGARIPVKSSYQDGGNNRPIFQINFNSHVSEFFSIISQLESKMDRDSQIPSSAVGFGSKIDSVRSTGIASIDQQNINKGIITKMVSIERNLIKPMVKQIISYHLWNTESQEIINGAVDVKVSGYSSIIRKQSKQQNLDLFIQNMVGMQNAINSMTEQGQDVSAIIALVRKYADQAGFNGASFFNGGTEQLAGEVAGQVTAPVPQEILDDGRTQMPDSGRIQ